MAVIPTPEQGKPILDFSAGTFDGSSNLFQSRNGATEHVSGDDVADYVNTSRLYNTLDTESKTPIGAINEINAKDASDIPYSQGVSVADKLDTIPTSYTYNFSYNSVDYNIKKYGDVVYLYLNGVSQTTYSTSWTEITTLPSNLVPSQILFFGALIPDNHVIMFRLLTNGKLYARCDTAASVYPQGSSVYMLV